MFTRFIAILVLVMAIFCVNTNTAQAEPGCPAFEVRDLEGVYQGAYRIDVGCGNILAEKLDEDGHFVAVDHCSSMYGRVILKGAEVLIVNHRLEAMDISHLADENGIIDGLDVDDYMHAPERAWFL